MEGPSKQDCLEVLKTPEIVVQNEEGAHILSLILEAKDPKWSNADNPLAKATKEYFEANPLNQEISGFLNEIHALQKDGVDEEVLYILALTYEHPEREEKAFETIREHKSYIKEPGELQQKLFRAIEVMKQLFSVSSLAEKFNSEAEQDKKERLENLEETKGRINRIIDFFKPDSRTTKINKISIMPTDPLYKVSSGYSFNFGEEVVLKTHIENPDNLEHEFSHSVINPIIDKLFDQLTPEQKGKISELASKKLKQDYGEVCYSLLCEEFIRTYNDVLKIGRKPQTYEDFQRKMVSIDDNQFQKELSWNQNLKTRCDELEIKTIEDFRNKSEEYFEKFERNLLRNMIFDFYQEYINRPDKNVNFEQFVLDNFASKI